MKKTFMIVLSSLLAVSLITGCSSSGKKESTAPALQQSEESAESQDAASSDGASQETIKIGGAYQLSGSKQTQGDTLAMGGKLAIAEINKAGGVLGRQLELVEQDAGETTQDTVTATTLLLEQEDISVVLGCLSSSDNIAVSDVIAEYQVPMFAFGSSANVFAEENDYIWQIRATDNYSAPIMSKVCIEQLKMEKPALFYCTYSFGQGMVDGLKKCFEEEYGITPACEIGFALGETNFAPLLTQVMASGCDGIIAIGEYNEASLIMKQVHAMDIDIPCVGSAAFGLKLNIENAGVEAGEGWYTISDWTPEYDTEKSHNFVKAWGEQYPGVDPVISDTFAYDAVYLIKEAIEIAQSAEPEAINEALGKIKDYQGAMSVYTPDENHSFATTNLLCRNRNDATVEIVEVLKFR